jgi:hypothetical protein
MTRQRPQLRSADELRPGDLVRLRDTDPFMGDPLPGTGRWVRVRDVERVALDWPSMRYVHDDDGCELRVTTDAGETVCDDGDSVCVLVSDVTPEPPRRPHSTR